jgi:type I restriction enzyme, S subunit
VSVEQLITAHLDIWTAADTEKKSGRGRSSGNAGSVYGVKKLRELILELAVRGKLVPQDESDEPASELLKKIATEKAKLVAEGKIKKTKPFAEIMDDEKPFDLPVGWKWARLGNVIDYVNGFAFSSKDFTTQGIGVVKIGDIQQGKIEPEFMSRISEDAVNGLEARLQVIKGDLVIAMSGATTGKLGFNDTEEIFYLNQRVGKIVPFIISKRFLYFDLTTKIAENLKKSFGSAIPNLSTEQINTIVTALPPISEQHRIVAKVDELMALCDQLENQHNKAAEAHEKLVTHLLGTLTQSQNAENFNTQWQRISEHFDTLFTTEASIDALKQTLLQLAVMGKLVPQDPNDEPASELLKRIQKEKANLIAEGKIKKDKPLAEITEEEKPFELPVGWEWVRLGDISSTVQYGYTDSADHNSKEVLFLRITDIQDDAVNWDTVPGCSISIADSESYALQNNDLVIARTGGTIGKSYLVDGLNQQAVFASYLIRIGNLSSTSAEYKKVFLGSKLYWAQLIASSMGTGQPNVNGTALKNLIFSLPPLYEQDRIVTKVDELMILCDQLKVRITSSNQLQQKLADVMTQVADC